MKRLARRLLGNAISVVEGFWIMALFVVVAPVFGVGWMVSDISASWSAPL